MKTIQLKLVKKVILCLFLGVTYSGFSQIGIGTADPSNQSSLDIRATDKGLLMPRLTTAQRTTLGATLTTAANSNNKGMQVFDTDLNSNWFWNGTTWVQVVDDNSTSRKVAVNFENTPLQPYQIVFIDPSTSSTFNKNYAFFLTTFLTYEATLNPIIGYVDSATPVGPQEEFYIQTFSRSQSVYGIDGTFSQNNEIWYRPFQSQLWGTTRDTQNPCFFLGFAKQSSGSAAGRLVSFDPKWFNTSNSNVLVNYKAVAANYPTTPSKGEMVYTTSTGAAGGTIYRIETYDGSSWALDKGVYTYIATLNYPVEVIVTKDDKLYQSNGTIPANTAFTIGTTGATWKQIGASSIPEWTDGGVITLGATTTAPTKPTTRVADKVYYKQIGPKTWEVEMIYRHDNVTGATAGSGDYLFTLPNGLQFDQSILTQAPYTANVGISSNFHIIKGLPNSRILMLSASGAATHPSVVVPWDATRFRISLYIAGTGVAPWGSGFVQINAQPSIEIRINFTFQSAN